MRSTTTVLVMALVTGCGAMRGAAPPTTEPLYDDLGTYHHAVTTRSELAQKYFDQGFRLLYGFNHDEAQRAFEQAARLDPECAMAYWGIALVVGPNYNMPMDPKLEKLAWDHVQKAIALKSKVTPNEAAYIDALAHRYTLDPAVDRRQLQVDYADAMREVARKFPDDLDAATLFAEAMMNLRPWDLWTKDGSPNPGTTEIVAALESVLDREPNHPGANHYHIHAIEASPQPDRALASAERLKTLVPGAGHLVHMPAHVYIRTGRYDEAAEANVQAIAVDRKYLAARNPGGMYPMMYYPHNIHFLWMSASMSGRGDAAVTAARDLLMASPMKMAVSMPMMEMFTPSVYLALARFERWKELLEQTAPIPELHFTTAMWHYARGCAHVGLGDMKEAGAELKAVQDAAAKAPADLIINLNSARSSWPWPNTICAAASPQRGKRAEAIRHFRQAVEAQDELSYDEPPAWYRPQREILGLAQLVAGRARDAEATFLRDLELNPMNPRSLYGLARSLEALGKKEEAAAFTEQFDKAWKGDGVPEMFRAPVAHSKRR